MPGFDQPQPQPQHHPRPHPHPQNPSYEQGMIHMRNGNHMSAMWSFIAAVENGCHLAWRGIGDCVMNLFGSNGPNGDGNNNEAELNAIKIQCRSMYRRSLLGEAGHENIHVDAILLNLKARLPLHDVNANPNEGEG